MDLHIMSLRDAVEHKPDKPTYAIRIFSSWDEDTDKRPLQKSPLYRRIAEYVFDDNDESHQAGPVTISEDTVEAIIRDFAEYKGGVESLLVHCSVGKNRSPAVAIALNEIFGLGHDTDELKAKYKESNWYVYRTILEAAQRHQF